jgi:hypothetical protein
VWVLLGHYALNPDVTTVWPGIAGLFQVVPSLSLLATLPHPSQMQCIKEHCRQLKTSCAQTSCAEFPDSGLELVRDMDDLCAGDSDIGERTAVLGGAYTII